MTPEDVYRFRCWVNRSPSHREAYKAVDRAWFVAGTAKDDPALSAIPLTVRATPSRWRLFAAVASILFVVGIGSATLTQFLIGEDRKSVGEGKSVYVRVNFGGRCYIKKKKIKPKF